MSKNFLTSLFYLILSVYWYQASFCASSVNPIWLPNSFFQTSSAQVKTNVLTTFNSTNPITKTFTFTKTYTQVPHLAFGIKNYRGSDQLGTQNFAITRTGLTQTGFTIYTMIDGSTNIRILTIIYLAVDRSFLYHLNVFNDIPANQANGNLVNITLNQVGVRQYRNVVNYTNLANTISSTHTLFGTNMAKNKVAVFLCAIYNSGNKAMGLQVKYSVTTQVLSADQFQIVVACQSYYVITLLRFSLVAMDIDDIEKSAEYTVVSYDVELPATSDQYISIPREFANNTLIGLVDYTTVNAYYGLEFNWEFDLNNDRIIFNHSVPVGSNAYGGLTFFRAAIFYIKTWYCPATHIYFNLITNMCDDYCAKYLYENSTAQECQACNFGCYECTSGPSAGCTLCNAADNREFFNGTCQCKSGFYPDPLGTTVCVTCNSQLANCGTCQKSPLGVFNCVTCDANSVWTGSSCLLCSTPNCLSFSYVAGACSCTQCNTGFILNGLGGCDLCSTYMLNCLSCTSQSICTQCDNIAQFYLNTSNNQCETCNTLTGCLTCQTLTTCKVCDSLNNYGLTSDGTCKQCPFNCACDGYVLPKYLNSTDGQQYCSTLCGDGMKRNFEECDDGNTVDGDGCSSTCTIEKAWSCDSNPTYTCCTLESNQLTLSINKILKVSKKNAMTLVLEIKPKLSILTPENMKKYVTLIVTGVPLYNESRVALPGQILQVTYFYNQSIHGKKGQIAFEISFSQVGAPSCVISASKNITIMAQASNNLPFMFYTEEDLAKQDEVADSANALEIITYVIFFLSMIPCKIIGLELIGVIQLAYFSLAQQENINVLLEPFMKMNEINGFNADWLKEEDTLSDQVSALGIKTLFLNNCNVMLLVIVVEVLTAGVLYGISHVMQSVSQKLSSVSKYLIKEGLLTLMMFNAFNIAFGVGVHFQYADKSDQSYVASSAAAILASGLLFAVCALLMFTEAKQFGEFKDKLKPHLMCQLYFVFSLGYRFALGYYIAVKNEYILSSLVIVGFCMVFIGYNLINLPFTDAYHNYRANICHCAQLVILFVTNYYDSLTENEPLQQKAYQFSAAEFQIAAIYIAVAFSAGCLVVDAYKFIKAKFSSSEASSPLNSIKKRLPEGQINQTLEDFEVNNSFHMKDNEMEILSAKKK